VLDADPELGDQLDPESRDAAARFAVAEEIRLRRGPWDPHPRFGDGGGNLALLVLSGVIKREVELANSTGAELLGQGDVIRPWQEDAGEEPGDGDPAWEVLEPARLALLDRRFALVAGRWPALIEALLARAIERSRDLAFHMAVSRLTRVDVRLQALFWHLAERWGRVGPDGVVVPLHLPHRTIARLVGAQRPSVTTALGTLADRRVLSRRDDGTWLLHGEPPAGLGPYELLQSARISG
jgi:CRP/FNR family transcriptional regulator, cyclic AMP receptor protein